ncbi:HNH endonuclease [Burkholderia cenocepacia]|uniref:HNH endonuclease n=1 Tax=Burkholderia cenocepacia TaxID=95486 RepID=UPI0019052A66|nr:HNH endonuclease [Burkholderia cenocepacia]MBJ9923830.1 HNH endonuclease [Burkholderia cenocepacia]
MIAAKKDLIIKELQEGTGAELVAAIDTSGLRSSLRIWFGDLDEKHGPIADLRPFGLKGHRVELSFGSFSRNVIRQIEKASAEDVQLARALVASIGPNVEIDIPGQTRSSWKVDSGSFKIVAKLRDQEAPEEDNAIVATCRNVIVPLMAAMAELIGYDVIEEAVMGDEPAVEGGLSQALITRRERNPRNRLLCIRLHGEKCVACGIEPRQRYGAAGTIIEVHHLESLASLTEPRPYDPNTDLVPLCPSCHRAVHTRRPVPFSVEDLRKMMEPCHG